MAGHGKPLVTIVISFRERWRFTARTVESIVDHTAGKFDLLLLDSGMPEMVRAELIPHVKAGKLKLVEVGPGEQPNQWRAQIALRLASRYVVFIDNDVVVTPGWLDAMMACAEETGAGIVCPLYLWGDSEDSDLIHMAGGDLSLVPTEAGVRMTESHRHVGRKISDVPDDLHRRPCGFGEYHCLMMRREVYSADGIFEPGIEIVHEHVHACMLARELGQETWFEPAARVNYLAFAPWHVGDLQALRSRWDYAAAERSLTQFAKRWNVIDDEDYRSPIRRFLAGHAGHTDLLDPRPGLAARRGQIMTRTDLQQTFGGLEWLALDRGYDIKDVKIIRRAYRLAMALTEGLYRPCGRPFINHLAGTASVLLFYGCPIPHVLAGLLHAAFTHGPVAPTRDWLASFRTANSRAGSAVKLAKLYAERSRLLDPIDIGGTGMVELPLDLAGLYLLDAANEVDMHLSLEIAVSGRTDVLSGKRLSNCQAVLDHVGLSGLAATLRGLVKEAGPIPLIPFQIGLTESFRIDSA